MKLNFSTKMLVGTISLLVLLTLATRSAQAQTYFSTTLHNFTGSLGNLGSPPRGLIMDVLGNFYGTSFQGGPTGAGSVFELVNSSGTYSEKLLYSFTNSSGDGAFPYAGLIMDAAGNLYGTTVAGGANRYGTVFELVNASGIYTEKVLYSFTAGDGGGIPRASLIMDAAGNLYGTTAGNTLTTYGAVFELVSSSGTYSEKVLYSFTASGGDGADPYAGLIMDAAGNLYGTTVAGGANGFGIVFELVNSPGSYGEKVLHSFTKSSGDGASPYAGLIMDAPGNLYGTTSAGGAHNLGTVFELINSSGTYSEVVLYNFGGGGGNDGANPSYAGLIIDALGNLYGTTYAGGAKGEGTVFELVNSFGIYSEKVLYSFGTACGGDGATPGGLIRDASGNFYGATSQGGAGGFGTVFRLTPFSGQALSTTTTLTSSSNPATAGDTMQFWVTVMSSSGFPTGTVTFSNGTTLLGTGPLSCGSATLSVGAADSLGIGTFTISAQYKPDVSTFTPSLASIIQTVNESGVALTSGNNAFTGNQTINGIVSATSFAGNGSNLTGLSPSSIGPGTAGINITGNAATATMAGIATDTTELGGVMASRYARLDISNNFTGNQTVAGNLSVTGNSSTTGTLTIGNGGTAIAEHLSMTFDPNFSAPSEDGSCSSVRFVFTGASDGDTIALGVPNSRMNGSLVYTAWVSAADTITIRVCAFPADKALLKTSSGSGAIRVDLWKH